MPRVRQAHMIPGQLRRVQTPASCLALDGSCDRPVVPGCPTPLCGTHLRRVYEFASDFVNERWQPAIREYVATLEPLRPTTTREPFEYGRGFIYFVRFSDRVKVGFSMNPRRRLGAIPHDEVIGVVPGTRADERAWHKLLADYHVSGEWFRAEPDLLALLSRVADQKIA